MGNLFIEVSNSYNGKIKQEDGKFITDKTDRENDQQKSSMKDIHSKHR